MNNALFSNAFKREVDNNRFIVLNDIQMRVIINGCH